MRPNHDVRARFRKQNRIRAAAAGLAALLALAPTGGAAAPAEEQEAAGEEFLLLDPITVTATRTPRRASTVGDSVEVLTKERIERRIPGDLLEVFREAVGALPEQTGSRGGTSVFRIRGSEPNFTSVLIDGFKVSSPDGEAFAFQNLSPEWIRQAEILRGPQSTLYGSDAAAGVVNLLLDVGRPGERPRFEAAARHGIHETYEESVKLKGGTEKAGYLGTFSRVDSGGRFPNDAYYRTVGTAAVDLIPTERAKARIVYQINQNRFANTSDSGATNSDLRLPFPLTDRDLDKFDRTQDELLGVRLELRPADWFEYIYRFTYYIHENLFEDRADVLDVRRPFFNPFQSETTRTRLAHDNQVNIRLKGSAAASITTLGFEFEEEKFFQQNDGFGRTTVNRRRLARSPYAQEQLTLFDALTLTGGFRVDDFDVGKDEVSFKVSGALKLGGTGLKVRGAYGEGVKRPSFNDLFGVAGFPGNPNLKSEQQTSWETGADLALAGRKLQLSGTFFESRIRDLIAFSFAGFPNGTNFENISKVRIRGAEFSVALLDVRHFTLRGNLNLLDTKVLDDRGGLGGGNFVQGQELLRRPNRWWSASAVYHPGRLRAGVRVTHVADREDLDFRPFISGRFTAPRVTNPGNTTVDLTASLDLVKDSKSLFGGTPDSSVRRFTIEIKVLNLLDEDYDEVFGFSAPGIQWFVGFRILL